MRFVMGFVMLFALVMIGPLSAQVSSPVPGPVAAPVVPTPDELDLAWLTAAQQAQKRANDACQGLPALQEYTTLRQQVQAKIESRHPGFTVDWATFTFKAKGKP